MNHMKGLTRIVLVAAAAAWALLSLAVPGHAVVFFSDRAVWEGEATSGFADVDITSINEFDFLLATDSLALPLGGTLSFDIDLERRQVPDSWDTWSGGKTPAVLYTLGLDTVVGTFGSELGGFGLEMEPDPKIFFDMTLTLNDGSFLLQQVTGDAGAKFFGWIGEGVVSMTLTCGDGTDEGGCFGFAFGEMVQAEIVSPTPPPALPAPGTLILLATGLTGMGLWGTRRRS